SSRRRHTRFSRDWSSDVCSSDLFIHAQKANRRGDVLIEGIIGIQKEAVLAARRAVVTVEEVVEDFAGVHPNACVLPHWTVKAIADRKSVVSGQRVVSGGRRVVCD